MISRKLLAVVCIVALLVSMASTYTGLRVFGQAGITLTTNTLTGGVNSGAPTYTVFYDGGSYHAKNAYGAITTSNTNAATVINSCVDSDQKVVLTGPFSNITDQIIISGINNFELTGNNAIITPDGTEANATIFISPSANNITISNIVFDGRYNTGLFNFAVQVQGKNVLLEKLTVNHYTGAGQIVFEHGAQFGRASHCIVSDSLTGVLGVGFIAVNCTDITFEYNTGYNLLQDGIDIYGNASRISCIGNNFYNNVGDGIHVEYFTDFGLGRCAEILISGNTLTSNGYGGNGLFGNDTLATGGYAGILVEGADHVTITDNLCSYNGRGITVANYRSGLSLDGSTYVTIANNHLEGNLFEGIHIKNSWFSSVSGNVVTLNKQDGILLNATSYCSIYGNRVVDNSQNLTNTYDGISLYGISQYNTFTDNILVSQLAPLHRYGLYAPFPSTAYNLISNCQSSGAGTANLKVDMTFNNVTFCYNGTSFIP